MEAVLIQFGLGHGRRVHKVVADDFPLLERYDASVHRFLRVV